MTQSYSGIRLALLVQNWTETLATGPVCSEVFNIIPSSLPYTLDPINLPLVLLELLSSTLMSNQHLYCYIGRVPTQRKAKQLRPLLSNEGDRWCMQHGVFSPWGEGCCQGVDRQRTGCGSECTAGPPHEWTQEMTKAWSLPPFLTQELYFKRQNLYRAHRHQESFYDTSRQKQFYRNCIQHSCMGRNVLASLVRPA